MLNQLTDRKNLINDLILLPFDLLLIFIATFSGEYKISYFYDIEIPLFLMAWIAIILVRRNLLISRREIYAQIIIFFFLLPILVQSYQYNLNYYLGISWIILYVNVIVFTYHLIKRLLRHQTGSKLVQWLPAIILILIGVLTQVVGGETSRISFIFGPNVYYRIIASVFLLHLVLFHERYSGIKHKISISSFAVTLLCLIATLFIMIETGSRAATIISLVMIILFLFTVIKIKLKWLKFASLFGISLAAIWWHFKTDFFNVITDSRAFKFYDVGPTSASFAAREQYWQNLPSFFLNDNFLLGEGSNYLYSYPHNIYLDLLYNGGFFPALMLVMFTIIYGILLVQGKLNHYWKILTIIVLPIYIGSFFSGTSYDNYSVISLIFALPILNLSQVPEVSKTI